MWTFSNSVEHKHSTVFSLPFLHLFYEKINVYSEQGAIHPLNYLSLPLWCLTGTSAMILLHRTAVGDSRSLWGCHVRAHNISDAKRRWRIRWFSQIPPYTMWAIPSLSIKSGSEIYLSSFIKAKWSVQCVPDWNFSCSLSESPITAAVRNMCTKPVEYRDALLTLWHKFTRSAWMHSA